MSLQKRERLRWFSNYSREQEGTGRETMKKTKRQNTQTESIQMKVLGQNRKTFRARFGINCSDMGSRKQSIFEDFDIIQSFSGH